MFECVMLLDKDKSNHGISNESPLQPSSIPVPPVHEIIDEVQMQVPIEPEGQLVIKQEDAEDQPDPDNVLLQHQGQSGWRLHTNETETPNPLDVGPTPQSRVKETHPVEPQAPEKQSPDDTKYKQVEERMETRSRRTRKRQKKEIPPPAPPRPKRGKTEFACPHCDMKFTKRLQLNIHRNKWHRFSCTACRLTFTRDADLQSHMQLQHQPVIEMERKRFTCQVCGFKCKARLEMTQHMMTEHCNESSDSESDKKPPSTSKPRPQPEVVKNEDNHQNANDVDDDDDDDDHFEEEIGDSFPDNSVFGSKRHKSYAKMKVCVDNFVCNICCTKFRRKRALFEHSETIHKDRILKKCVPHSARTDGHYRCSVCRCYLTTYENMMDHVFRHRGIKPYACKYCPMLYSTRGGLGIHCYKHHEAEVRAELILRENGNYNEQPSITDGTPDREAPYAKAMFDPEYMPVTNDDLTSAGRAVLVCSICRIRVRKLSLLYEHCAEKHPDKRREDVGGVTSGGPYKCKECGIGFNRTRPLREHLISHYDIKPYMCKFCGKLYYRSCSMNGHTLQEHPDWSQKNTCGICKQRFPNLPAHRAHMKEAHGINAPTSEELKPYWTHRDYICSECGMKFRAKDLLHQHAVEEHVVVVPAIEETLYDLGGEFACRDCPLTFLYKSQLILHELKHRAITPFICKKCGRGFMHFRYLRKHAIVDHTNANETPKSYFCNFCDKEFSALDILVKHIEKDHYAELNPVPEGKAPPAVLPTEQHVEEWIVCETCQVKFSDNIALDRHLKYSHADMKPAHFWYCSYCQVIFSTQQKLFSHVESVHDLGVSKNLHCELCKRKFTRHNQLLAHKMQHHKMRPHACGQCADTFRTQYGFKRHLKKHAPEPDKSALLNCIQCGLQTAKKGVMRAHMRSHLGVKLKCKSCPETFYSKKKLKQHTCCMITYPHLCTICGIRFQQKSEMLRHRSMHPRNIPCDSCNKMFKSQVTLNRHKAIYHEAPKLLCPECGAMFAFHDQLRKHLQHHKEMKHACTECPRKFWGYRQLQQHVNMEHKEKRFICELCGRALSQKWHYQAHMRCHAGERRYGCVECGKSYTTLNAQNYHIKKVHPERWTKQM